MKKVLWIVAGIAGLAVAALVSLNRRQIQIHDLTWRVEGSSVKYEMTLSNLTDTEIIVSGPVVAERVRVDPDGATRVMPVAQHAIAIRLAAREKKSIAGSIELGKVRSGSIVVTQNLAIQE